MPVTNNSRSTERGNPTNNTSARWSASVAVNPGDLIYQTSTGTDQPASSFPFLADLASTQRAFRQQFRGMSEVFRLASDAVAATESFGGIQTGGEVTMTCSALGTAVVPGQFVGPASNAGTALYSNQVVICTPDCAIGVVTQHAAAGITELTFQLLDTLTTTGTGGATFGLGETGFSVQAAPTALTTSATLTAANLLTGFMTANQGAAGAATYTLPTGTLMDAAMPPNFPVNGSFWFAVTNISTNAAEIATVAAGTGFTVVGNMTIAANGATTSQATGLFLVRKTAANTYVCYRIAS